jgi:hypothetical protein
MKAVIEPSHVSQAQAARMLRVSRQAISYQLRSGGFSYINFCGDKMIPLAEVKSKVDVVGKIKE